MIDSMGPDCNPEFGISSIPFLGIRLGHTARNMRPRDILQQNLKALMAGSRDLNTIEKLSKASGVSKGVVERMTKAEANSGVDHLAGIARAFGIPLSALVEAQPQRPPPPQPKGLVGSVISDIGQKIAAAAPTIVKAFEDEFVAVRRADVRFANGIGQIYYEADDKPPLVFRMDFLRKLGVKSGKAVVVDSRGISNEPKIRDGSVVLVNSGDTENLDNDFFAFRYDGELLIKRLERVEGIGILATAENSDFKPKSKLYKADELQNFEIIGRAVWEGAEL